MAQRRHFFPQGCRWAEVRAEGQSLDRPALSGRLYRPYQADDAELVVDFQVPDHGQRGAGLRRLRFPRKLSSAARYRPGFRSMSRRRIDRWVERLARLRPDRSTERHQQWRLDGPRLLSLSDCPSLRTVGLEAI